MSLRYRLEDSERKENQSRDLLIIAVLFIACAAMVLSICAYAMVHDLRILIGG